MASGDQPGDETAGSPPALRASDAERERAATLLREHTAAGRLTPEELAERLDAAYTARTVADLDALTHDLPAASDAPVGAARSTARERARRHVLQTAGFLVLVNVAAVAIWLATGADGSFWPKWVLLASVLRFAFFGWGALGPGGAAAHDEARLGRGGARGIEHAERGIEHAERQVERAKQRVARAQRRVDRR